MADDRKTRTFESNGRLWGTRAQDWSEFQEPIFRHVYEAVLAQTGVGSGSRYLDIGCGAGLAVQLATGLGAQVSGIDASEGLLAIARSRAPGADIRQGDLEDLPFADDSFDVVTGFNSFQYAGNPGIALGEARRVSKPGGAVVIVTWGDPEGMEAAAMVRALAPLMPPPPPGRPGPFALSDESALRRFATDAGLKPELVFDVDSPKIYANEEAALRGWASSGNAARVIEAVGEPAVADRLAEVLAPFRQPDGTFRMGASYRCLLARP